MGKWVLVSPEISKQDRVPVYFWLIVCDSKGRPQGAGITRDISEAATFPTKRAAMESSAHKQSTFVPEKVTGPPFERVSNELD